MDICNRWAFFGTSISLSLGLGCSIFNRLFFDSISERRLSRAASVSMYSVVVDVRGSGHFDYDEWQSLFPAQLRSNFSTCHEEP